MPVTLKYERFEELEEDVLDDYENGSLSLSESKWDPDKSDISDVLRVLHEGPESKKELVSLLEEETDYSTHYIEKSLTNPLLSYLEDEGYARRIWNDNNQHAFVLADRESVERHELAEIR